MRQNMGKTAGFCNAAIDFLINLAATYLAVLLLEGGIHEFNKTTMVLSSVCAVGSIVVYFSFDIYSSMVFENM